MIHARQCTVQAHRPANPMYRERRYHTALQITFSLELVTHTTLIRARVCAPHTREHDTRLASSERRVKSSNKTRERNEHRAVCSSGADNQLCVSVAHALHYDSEAAERRVLRQPRIEALASFLRLQIIRVGFARCTWTRTLARERK